MLNLNYLKNIENCEYFTSVFIFHTANTTYYFSSRILATHIQSITFHCYAISRIRKWP